MQDLKLLAKHETSYIQGKRARTIRRGLFVNINYVTVETAGKMKLVDPDCVYEDTRGNEQKRFCHQ